MTRTVKDTGALVGLASTRESASKLEGRLTELEAPIRTLLQRCQRTSVASVSQTLDESAL